MLSASALGRRRVLHAACRASLALPPQSAIARAPVRCMGILDRMKSMVENSRKDTISKKKGTLGAASIDLGLRRCRRTRALTLSHDAPIQSHTAEIFQWQLDSLAALDTFTMAAHRTLLEQTAEKLGLHDWRAALRTRAQQAEMEDQWVDLRIAQSLRPEEVADPDTALRRREKLRIAGELGLDVSKVNAFLVNYEQTRGMHKWIASRKRRGLPLPHNLEDYQAAMLSDRTGIDRDMAKLNAPRNRSTTGALKRAFK